jgi:hypothetical protein
MKTVAKMAERGGHAPHRAKCATSSLAKSPGSLVRFTFRGAHGENCTRTVRDLKSVPLLLGYVGEKVLPVGFAPTLGGV